MTESATDQRDIAIRALASVLERIHSPEFSLRAVMETILDYAIEAAKADVGSIVIADEESDSFKLVALRGDIRRIQHLESHYPVDHGIQHRVLRTATHAFLPNVRAEREYVSLWDGIESELCIPILHQCASCVGVLTFDFCRPTKIDDVQIEFLKLLAAQAVSAISIDRLRNGQMLAKVERKLLARETCFVLMPFSNPFNKYYSSIIVPAAEEAGLSTFRADSLYGPANLMLDIFENIKKAKVLIAELTTRNPNVMYELGLAHALHKPVILITQNIEDVPFDLRAIRCLVYDVTDPNWASDLATNIKMSIEAIHNEARVKKRFGPFAT